MELQKVIVSLIFASTTAYSALLLRNALIGNRKPKYVTPTVPEFVDDDWTGMEQTKKQVIALKMILA